MPLSVRISTTVSLLLLGVRPLVAQQAAIDSSEIRTTGTAQRSVPPDVAVFTLSFTVMDSSPTLASARLAARADSVRRALMALGVPRDSMVSGTRWHWWPGRMEVVPHTVCAPTRDPQRGCVPETDSLYRAREIIQVRTHDLTRIGRLIDTAFALGVIEISNVNFTASDTRAVQDEAVREATVRARQQAEAIAAAAGRRLGAPVRLSTQPDYPEIRYGTYGEVVPTGVSVDVGRPVTEVTAPSVTVRATVYGRWRLLAP